MVRRLLLVLFSAAALLTAETGYDAWLRYEPINDLALSQSLRPPARVRHQAR